MTLEPGFRRLTVVVSVVVLGLGAMIDLIAVNAQSFEITVQAVLENGQTVVVDVPEALASRDKLETELVLRHKIPVIRIVQHPRYGRVEEFARIVDVRVVHRPAYWRWWLQRWWTEAWGTKAALVLVGLLWTVFYVSRWIAHGFARP